jgi:ketosteroid isomerase-like protein
VPKQDVELHRRANAAIQALDADALVDLCDASIEVHSIFAAVGGAVYHGHEGVRSWLPDLDDAWSEFLIEPEAYFDLGEYTLAYIVLHGRGRQSGAEVVMPYAQVMRWREGSCVYFRAYVQREDALRDLGLTETALEPIAP